ncbi:MAG: heme NO-binding domain-containing protein [Pseudomonadota bacterium]
MHGLVNRAIQRFVTDSYGAVQWQAAAERADLGFTEFEAMWSYEDALTTRVLAAVSDVLDRPYDELMEDIGTYLVSHRNVEALRRLMRFSGLDFHDFLQSLDELPDRARVAVPDLELPKIELHEVRPDYFELHCAGPVPGCGYLLMGILRTMADDYGALVYLEHDGETEGLEKIRISLLEAEFAEGKDFELGAGAG